MLYCQSNPADNHHQEKGLSTSIRQNIAEHKQVAWLIALFVILGLIYSIATPIFEASDEIFHYPVVQHIATTGQLPVQVVGQDTAWEQEGSQPPLYYGLVAALTVWINTDDLDERLWYNPHAKLGVPLDADNKNMVIHTDAERWPWRGSALAVHLIRVVSVFLAAGSVALGYGLALQIAPGDRWLALLTAALMAFNPMFLFISASVNNDNLLILLSTATLYLLARVLNAGLTRRRVIWLALVVALSTLTKLSGLTLLPLVGLVLLVHALRTGQWRESILAGLGVAVACVAIAGWWYLRNLRLYGELTGLETMVAVAGPRLEPVTLLELSREWQGFWLSYWGLFGAVNILADWVVYLIYNIIFVVGVGGLLLSTWRTVRTGERHDLLLPGLLLLQTLVVFAGLVRWTMLTLASQGRLMFPVLAGISGLLALGWTAWFPAGRRHLVPWVVGLAMFVIAAVIPWRTLAPVYAAPSFVSAPPEDAIPVNVTYGESLELVAIETFDAVVQPGGYLPVTLYWRANAPIHEDYSTFVHALGRDAIEVGKVDAYPGTGRQATSLMPPGIIVQDDHLIPLDETLDVPTGARVLVGVWHYPTQEHLILTGPDGGPLENVIVRAGSIVPSEPVTLEAPIAQEATLGDFARLIGYDLSQSDVSPGETVTVDLYWRGLGTTPTSLTVFVHLVNEAGETVAQADAPPLHGDYPTTAWQPNIDVVDPHALTLPDDLPPGEYTLLVGFYDASDPAFTRAVALALDGARYPDDAIPLSTMLNVIQD
jgi:4-amino-4-deoxy-L-arabinose transferase-like glycosyltransferase